MCDAFRPQHSCFGSTDILHSRCILIPSCLLWTIVYMYRRTSFGCPSSPLRPNEIHSLFVFVVVRHIASRLSQNGGGGLCIRNFLSWMRDSKWDFGFIFRWDLWPSLVRSPLTFYRHLLTRFSWVSLFCNNTSFVSKISSILMRVRR